MPNAFFAEMLVDALVLAIVGYCVSLSMAKLFATKFDYPMDGTQEMLSEVRKGMFEIVWTFYDCGKSQGLANIVGSFFMCTPCFASMARSLVQVNVGGKTQMVSIISGGVLILVLLFIGPLFEDLPKV